MLRVESLSKRYGERVAVNAISFSIAQGETVGLLGPNGAGKTTAIAMISGISRPDGGEVILSGVSLAQDANALKRRVGLVPQDLALYEELSAWANLELFGGLYGLGAAELHPRAKAALALVGLADRSTDRVNTFSGGMKRRLNIAGALLHEPDLILLDEPTVGVDPQSRNAIFDLLQELNRAGMTIIYSTHYMEEATRLCSRIGIIDHGRILAQGTIDELLGRLPFEEEIRFPAASGAAALALELAAHGELATVDGVHRFRPKPGYPLSSFFTLTEAHGLPPRLFASQRPTLEALFLHLTGRVLRE